jgi:hypothetical protein
MILPSQVDLPFFSYGLFRPGQIGFGRLRPFVASPEAGWHVKGSLLVRDGLPVLDKGNEEVQGVLIRFRDGVEQAAYEIISGIEPDKLYRWETRDVHKADETVKVNLLVGKKPRRGSHPLEEAEWDGRNEPLFASALEVVQETLEQNRKFDWDLKPLFRLQMAYLLLWTAIERFASFKYHLGRRVKAKISHLASEPAFISGLGQIVKGKREVISTDDPGTKDTLDPTNPAKALDYYYQVRSNIVHRGKTAIRDHEILVTSLEELSELFRSVLHDEFDSSA